MKKFLVSVFLISLLIVPFIGCEIEQEEEVEATRVEIAYNGYFWVFLYNETPTGVTKLYCAQRKGLVVFNDSRLKEIFGTPYKMNIKVNKIVGSSYPDMGTLILTVYKDNKILDQSIIGMNEKETEIDVVFSPFDIVH